jgi:hypothetical protein
LAPDDDVKIAAMALTLLCALSTLAGCAMMSQPGVLPSAEEQCANVGGTWAHGLCRYRGGP